MFIAFMLAAVAIWSLWSFGRNPLWFVITSGMIYFTWGEIYSLFPSTCTDIYGFRYATTNAGMLYTAKGVAALLVPLANVLAAATGSWTAVFAVASALNIVAAALALIALKPARIRAMAKRSSPYPSIN